MNLELTGPLLVGCNPINTCGNCHLQQQAWYLKASLALLLALQSKVALSVPPLHPAITVYHSHTYTHIHTYTYIYLHIVCIYLSASVLAGTEFAFFTAAPVVLCFGYVAKLMLITYGCFACLLAQPQGFLFPILPYWQLGWAQARIWEGTQLGQLAQTGRAI